MSHNSIAFFRCEASTNIGAGHVMRSEVIADALVQEGWRCTFVTSKETYDFIPALSRFERIDPETFYANPTTCGLLVVDHYDLDATYEARFRPYAGKILVIDDLANRAHDCDVLLDQTYGRHENDYKNYVPESCIILTGSTYTLIRSEFFEWRDKAIEKRKNTTEIKKILISMGGSDPHNYTLEALKLLQQSGFQGEIDIVLGFTAPHFESINSYIASIPNDCKIISNANMPELIYEADLAIAAAGSSVWERAYLGLPSVLIKTADNQNLIYESLIKQGLSFTIDNLFLKIYDSNMILEFLNSNKLIFLIDGLGIQSLLKEIKCNIG